MCADRHPAVSRRILGVLALALAIPLVAQDGPGAAKHIDAVWAADLPPGWRELGREEVIDVANLPFDTPAPAVQNGTLRVFGDVDRWLASGVAGGALVVMTSQGERDVDAALLAELRTTYDEARTDAGERRVIESVELGPIGPAAHPAIRLRVRGEDAQGRIAFRSIDLCTATSGKLLILSLRAWENEWSEFEPKLAAIASSMTFARPPRQRGELGDALLQAAVFGGIIIAVLLVLRSFLRRRPPEHQLSSTRAGGPESGSPSEQ